MKKGIEHLIKIEMAYWFGQDTSGTARTLKGVDSFISSNRSAASATPSEGEFEAFMEDAFRYGSSEKWAFCGAEAITEINQFAVANLQVTPRDSTYGIAVKQYLTAHGMLNIVKHNLFQGGGVNDGGAGYDDHTDRLSKRAYIIDINDVSACPLRDTVLNTDIQSNDADVIWDEYLTETTLEVGNEKKHMVITNLG
jgi:hypothetical protein